MALQHFIVGGAYLGNRLIENRRLVPGLDVRWHFSYNYYCLRCGEIWGRLLHDQAEFAQIICRPCLTHGDGRLSFTHFVAGEPYNFADDWPEAAVKSEFLAELTQAEYFATHVA
jgi:hypothetical protein